MQAKTLLGHLRGTRVLVVLLSVGGLLLALGGAGAVAPAVQAATACSGSTFIHDGTTPNWTQVYGTKADIDTYNPALCGQSWSFSAVWVMVTGGDLGCEWAQAGYLRLQDDSSPLYFAEYRRNCSVDFVRFEGATASGTHNYYTTYNRSQGRMYMGYDSTNLLYTDFDPALVWLSGWTPQWEGEVHDNGDDIVGAASNPVYASNLKWQRVAGGTWETPSGLTLTSGSPRYGSQWDTANSQFHIWTK